MKALWIAALLLTACAAGIAQDSGVPMCRYNEVHDSCKTVPKLIHNVSAEYSEYGRKKRINGTVLLKFTVQSDGTTADIVVTRGLEKSLDAQAVKAVQQWRFEPSTYQGQPVAVSISAEVNFRLY